MTDVDVERALGRYAPAAPPASLRARVLAQPVPVRDRWLWIAAAAMVVVALGMHVMASRTIDASAPVPAAAAGADAAARAAVDALPPAVRGDAQALEAVRALLAAQFARDDRDAHDRAVIGATWIR